MKPTDTYLRGHARAAQIVGSVIAALGIPLIIWFVTR